ncbi:MAG: hypothetical protein Q8936_17175 [Bacillota bacterium]|nr:hypothetical protein [Bacillota bacterium]
MLSSIFQIILPSLKSKLGISEVTLLKVLEYIQNKPLNSYIFIEKLEEQFGLTLSESAKLLTLLEKESIIKQVYKLYCTRCQDFSSEVFEDINELEEQEVCEVCGKELYDKDNPYKYVVIYFRVIKNE